MYGKPSTHPYYFKIYYNGKHSSTSGVFKTKKYAISSAKEFSKGKSKTYRVFDRRRK